MDSLTTAQLLQELHISRTTLYHLLEAQALPPPAKQGNRCLWSPAQVQALRALLPQPGPEPVPPVRRTVSIQNRRYLGNKAKLTGFIRETVERECRDVRVFADIFAGTGAVAAAFTDKKLIVNDLLYSNHLCHLAWFGAEPVDVPKIAGWIDRFNRARATSDNYMSKNFADTYFSRAVCRKIGYIRGRIETLHHGGEINERERAVLVTSLLYAMDRIANTCGHYDAYREAGDRPDELVLALPDVDKPRNPHNWIPRLDANALVRQMEADVVYIDPPYNSRQYGDIYHLLENVAEWKKPPVQGKARKMARDGLKSAYCTKQAADAFEDLVQNIRARYIVLSYNNMAQKGDGRSNARISDADIWRILSAKGEVRVFSRPYKPFSAGKSAIDANEERLFLCVCREQPPPAVSSPLNYVGGKFRLLPQLLPHFPAAMDQCVDLFCGGGNVGLNVPCRKVTFVDSNAMLIGLFQCLQGMERDEVLARVRRIIRHYGLSRSSEKGYAYYHCNGSDGLAAYNKAPYLRLRADFNQRLQRLDAPDAVAYLQFYVLVVYAFNNQIRFNSRGEFNLPVGKRDFNDEMAAKLSAFLARIHSGDYTFRCGDFRAYPLDTLTQHSFVYADPPYLLGLAPYNEQGGWDETCDRDLFAFLDELDRRHIRFALSNVLRNKGRENPQLLAWLEAHAGRYRVIPLAFNYANASYQTHRQRAADTDTEEVLIVNVF